MQAVLLLGVIVAPTLGPTLGGWITDNYTWNWCFFINVPIGLLSMLLVTTFLLDPPDRKANSGAVDWWGIGLLTIGVGGLQYVLEEGNKNDWFESAMITRLAVVALTSLAVMVWWELNPRNKSPVVDFHLLKNRTLASSLFLFIALGFGLYGGVFLFPSFAQGILNFTPTETGLVMMPGGIATGFSALVCGALLNGAKPKADPRGLIGGGVILFATDQRLGMTTQGLLARGMDAVHAQAAALQVLNGQVQRQATMLGFNDAWMLVLIVFALVSPAILLLRRAKAAPAPSVDQH